MLESKKETRSLQRTIEAAIVYAILFGVSITMTATCSIEFFILQKGSFNYAGVCAVLAIMSGYLAYGCVTDAFRKLNS